MPIDHLMGGSGVFLLVKPVDLTCQHTNHTVLIEGPQITIRPVGTRRLSVGECPMSDNTIIIGWHHRGPRSWLSVVRAMTHYRNKTAGHRWWWT
jgi:hypothetical protein